MGAQLTVGWKKEKHALGRARHGKRHGSRWRGIGAVQDVLGSWSVPTTAEINAPLWTRKEGHEIVWEHVKTDVMLEKGEFPDRNVEGWKVEEQIEELQGRSARC